MGGNYRKEYINKLNSDGHVYEKEVLAMFLSNADYGRDMTEVAEEILLTFPSIRAAMNAEYEQLLTLEKMTPKIAAYLKTANAFFIAKEESKTVFIKSEEDFVSLVKRRLCGKADEFAEFYEVNARGRVVKVKTFTSDKMNTVQMDTNDVVKIIAKDKPKRIYLAHNHVSAPCRPSLADDKMTYAVMHVCKLCGVKFCDHCVVNARGEHYSYAENGRLKWLEDNQEIKNLCKF